MQKRIDFSLLNNEWTPKYKIGEMVVPVSKTAGRRGFDNCASFYRMLDLEQGYLYVNGVDEESSNQHGEVCYWCDVVRGMGDIYRESDLISYF